jgi:coenzyme PQQ precursor peptide PqqA
MHHPLWTRPEFREINLSAEIGMYCEDSVPAYFDDPSDRPDTSPTSPGPNGRIDVK